MKQDGPNLGAIYQTAEDKQAMGLQDFGFIPINVPAVQTVHKRLATMNHCRGSAYGKTCLLLCD